MLQEGAVDQAKVRVLPDGRMSPPNAAIFLGYDEKTLAIWRSRGIGPRYVKVQGKVFYYLDDLLNAPRGKAA